MNSKRLALVSLPLIVALAACGKGDVKPASSGSPETTEAEAATTTTTEAEAVETSLSFTATEYAYAAEGDAGAAPIPAGPVTVTLTNTGAEEHQISIVKLKPGKTQEDFAALAGDISQFDDVLETWGGPNGVAPGGSNTSTQVLEAGEYLFACLIPAPDGVPHAAKGMLLPVTVEGGEGGEVDTALPDGVDQISLSDYSFGLGTAEEPTELSADDGWVIVNDGPQAHEAAIYTAAEGSTMDDVVAYFSNPEPAGPPPIVGAGGIGPIDVGRWVEAPLEPGEYVFVCFIPDAADGAPHFTKGMIGFATVT